MAAGLTRRIGIVALGRAAHTASLLATLSILTRHWPKDEVALYQIVWLLVNTLVPIAALGMPAALLYFFPRLEKNRRRSLVAQGLAGGLAGAALLGLLLFATGGVLARLIGAADDGQAVALLPYLRPFLPYAVFLVVGGALEAVLVAGGRAHWQAQTQLVFALAAILWVWGAGQAGLSLVALLGGWGLMGLARLAVGAVLVWRCATWEGPWGLEDDWRQRWGYARTIWHNDVVGSASRLVDSLVVLHYFRLEIYAEYRLGNIEVPVNLLLAATVTVLVPEVSRLYRAGDLDGIGRLWRESVARLVLVVWPLFFFLFAYADAITAILYPDDYSRTAWVFRVFLLALPLRAAVYNPLLVGMGRAGWALWGSLLDLGLNLGLSLAAVAWLRAAWPAWAYLGPAGATVVSTYVQVLFLLVAIAWHMRWGAARLLPWGALARVALIGAAAAWISRGAASSWAAASGEYAAWAAVGGGGVVFAATYAAGLCLIAPERRRLLALVRGAVGR